MEEKEFSNENRKRYYGLRIGDIVDAQDVTGRTWGRSRVLDFGFMDNNRVIIENKNGEPIEWVAEWCEIVTKVEDIMETQEQENELVLLVKESGLADAKQNEITQLLSRFFNAADEAEATLQTLVITDPKETGKMRQARQGRLTIREARLEGEKLLDAMRRDVQLKMADFKNEDAILLKSKQLMILKLSGIEKKFQEKEDFAANWEKQEKENRRVERLALIEPYREFLPVESLDLSNMTPEGFDKLIAGAKAQQEQKEKDAAEAERIRKETEAKAALHKVRHLQFVPLFAYSDISPLVDFGELSKETFDSYVSDATAKKDAYFEEQEKIKADNERLKKEQDEAAAKLKVIQDKAAADKKKADDAAAKLKAESDAKLKKEQDEKVLLQKQIADKKAADEKAVKDAADLKAKQDADKIAADAKAAKQPDKQKLKTWMFNFNIPGVGSELKTDEATKTASEIMAKFEGWKKWANGEVEKL